MAFGHPLSARELAELWPDGGAQPRTLSTCDDCRAEYDALAQRLALAARDAADEADEHFTPDRLAAQHTHILRRLENAERPARVLHFPLSTRPSRAPATAPGAGLPRRPPPGSSPASAPDGASSSAIRRRNSPRVQAELAARRAGHDRGHDGRGQRRTLLREIEDALVEPRVDELRALDALTPRVRRGVARSVSARLA